MAGLKDVIQWQTGSGEAVVAGDTRVTPQSQALIIRWPNGGFVWNRPLAVGVERNGTRERIPIVDVTRLVQWGLLGLGAVFVAAAFARPARRRRD